MDAIVDRDKIKLSGLRLTDINLFGKTYAVYAQADAKFRDQADDVALARE